MNRPLLAAFALAAIIMLAADVSAQSPSYKVHGYVSYNGTPMNGITVTLSGGVNGQPANVTHNDASNHPGYYEIAIENGSGGMTLSASHNNSEGSYSFVFSNQDKQANFNIPVATATATPTPTPTPRPSGDMGGVVARNGSATFTPMQMTAVTPTAVLRSPAAPSPSPAAAPTNTPAPAPAQGLLSNVYVWIIAGLVVALAMAAAAWMYFRK